MAEKDFIQAARKASENAYAPYSGYKVGAAVLMFNGTVYTGCNIENAAYGSTMCAERTAMYKMASENKNFKQEAVGMALYVESDELGTPCGSCLQVMAELLDMDTPVVLSCRDESKTLRLTVRELFPYAFTQDKLSV